MCNPHQAVLGNTRAAFFVTPEQKREALRVAEAQAEVEKRLVVCEQCGTRFLAEPGEFLCSEACQELFRPNDEMYGDVYCAFLEEVL